MYIKHVVVLIIPLPTILWPALLPMQGVPQNIVSSDIPEIETLGGAPDDPNAIRL